MKKPATTEREFIEHLKSEIIYLRGDNAFLKGKCERLELAVLQPKGIETFTPAAPIEHVKVEARPKVSSWRMAEAEFNSLSDEEKQRRLDGGIQ